MEKTSRIWFTVKPEAKSPHEAYHNYYGVNELRGGAKGSMEN